MRIEIAEFRLTPLRRACFGHQQKISEAMGISAQAVSQKVNGHTRLLLKDLNIICEILGRKPSEFLRFREIDSVDFNREMEEEAA